MRDIYNFCRFVADRFRNENVRAVRFKFFKTVFSLVIIMSSQGETDLSIVECTYCGHVWRARVDWRMEECPKCKKIVSRTDMDTKWD